MPLIRGSCLCGGVKFEIAGPLTAPLNWVVVQFNFQKRVVEN